MSLWDWFADPVHWQGQDGIPHQVLQHLGYSFAALAVALLVALPLGVWVGHTGRGEVLIGTLTNGLRALPTLGVLILAVMVAAPLIASRLAFVIPAIAVLVVLAVPPILTATYAGIQAVDRGAVGAAVGLGYTPWQVVWHVELPCALPLVLSGVRAGILQIVSTATVAAYVSLGGLGRFIIDGRAQSDYTQMAAGAVLVALLALVLELLFVAASRLVVSPGLSGRYPRRRATMPATTPSPV